jgi:hypothetical protein
LRPGIELHLQPSQAYFFKESNHNDISSNTAARRDRDHRYPDRFASAGGAVTTAR